MNSAARMNALNKRLQPLKDAIHAAKMAGNPTDQLEAMLEAIHAEKRKVLERHTGKPLETFPKPSPAPVKDHTAVLGMPAFLYKQT